MLFADFSAGFNVILPERLWKRRSLMGVESYLPMDYGLSQQQTTTACVAWPANV